MRITEEERMQICSDLYEEQKSRNFMLHLVRAYSKPENVVKVFAFGEKQRKKCVVCNARLMDLEGALEIAAANKEEIGKDIVEQVRANIKGTLPSEHPLAKYYKGKVLAYSGEGTDTCACVSCVTAIMKFTVDKLMKGDKGINRTIRDMQDKANGIVREPRYRHKNVEHTSKMSEAAGFSELAKLSKK